VPKSLTIEYSDRSNASKWYQLEVPFVDAMHLLALLQGAKDVGYKEPVEAPAPPRKTDAPAHCDRLHASLPGSIVPSSRGTEASPSRRSRSNI
jgi:hypothetical protein